jgi:hypothetical protein
MQSQLVGFSMFLLNSLDVVNPKSGYGGSPGMKEGGRCTRTCSKVARWVSKLQRAVDGAVLKVWGKGAFGGFHSQGPKWLVYNGLYKFI